MKIKKNGLFFHLALKYLCIKLEIRNTDVFWYFPVSETKGQ